MIPHPEVPDGLHRRSGGRCGSPAPAGGGDAEIELSVLSSPVRALIGTGFPIRADELVIGRDPGADIQAPDRGASRRHARLARSADGRWAVSDLGSTNGTFVNGARVQSALLSPGDHIQIGDGTEFVFRLAANGRAEGEIRLRQALAVAGAGAWSWEAASGHLSFSGGIVGRGAAPYDRTELQLHDFWSRIDERDRAALRSRLEESAREGSPCQIECRMQRSDGSAIWVAMAGEVCRDPGGATRVAGTAVDVTDRRRAEAEMHRQSVLLDALSDGVVAIDHRGTILDWNARAESMFGWSRAEVLGRSPGEIFLAPDRDDDLTSALLERAHRGERFAEERTLRRKDGHEIAIEVVAVPLRDPGGHQIACVAVLRDVDERRRMLAQLHVAERLAALGTLASGVAHEINNPLAFILANLSWARARLAGGEAAAAQGWPEISAALGDCEKGAERIRAIVQALRAHSAPDPGDVGRPVDVNAVIDFVLRVADPELRHRARVTRRLEPVPPVQATQAQLGQVFLNLLVNAAESIPDGAADEGEISVATRFDAASGGVQVAIADTGSGIAPQDLAHIFDPFFTREQGGSGGLGLYVCHRIVTALGGRVSAESIPGSGSVFRVTLPAVPHPTCCAPLGHSG